jgi:transposase-like protein
MFGGCMEYQRLNSKKRFSLDQKREILSEHLDHGIPISVLARRNNIHAVTLHQWKRVLMDEEKMNSINIDELIAENKRLQLELKNVKAAYAEEALFNREQKVVIEYFKKKSLEQRLKSQKSSRKKKSE